MRLRILMVALKSRPRPPRARVGSGCTGILLLYISTRYPNRVLFFFFLFFFFIESYTRVVQQYSTRVPGYPLPGSLPGTRYSSATVPRWLPTASAHRSPDSASRSHFLFWFSIIQYAPLRRKRQTRCSASSASARRPALRPGRRTAPSCRPPPNGSSAAEHSRARARAR